MEMKERGSLCVEALTLVAQETPPSVSSKQPITFNAIMKCKLLMNLQLNYNQLLPIFRVKYVRVSCQKQYMQAFDCLKTSDDENLITSSLGSLVSGEQPKKCKNAMREFQSC